ncbi:MAG: MBL fold metallo-hydrolase [Proteobacteria bacterium]|nr:MBL fold metallo-hydrolase [Pseudomonadota bacterium]
MNDYFEIDFLEINAKRSGDAIAARYEIDGEIYIHVVDGGYQDTGEKLASHIRQYYGNPSYIDHVVVTHPDGDHAGGLRTILEEFEVGQLWMLCPWYYVDELIGDFSRFTSVENLGTRLREIYPNLNALEEIAIRRGIAISEPFQGDQIGAFTVLAPSKDRYLQLVLESEKTPESVAKAEEDRILARGEALVKRAIALFRAAWGQEVFSPEETSAENNMSVVQYASLCGRKILLTGDAGRDALSEAADFAPNLGLSLPGIDRFQVPHHGSRRNVSSEVLDRWLGPKLIEKPNAGQETFSAFISASQEDKDHPRKVVVRALIHRGAKVVSTGDRNGTKRTSQNAPDRDGWSSATLLDYPEDMEE